MCYECAVRCVDGGPCPLCKIDLDLKSRATPLHLRMMQPASALVHRQLSKVQVRCAYYEHGCKWIGMACTASAHYTGKPVDQDQVKRLQDAKLASQLQQEQILAAIEAADAASVEALDLELHQVQQAYALTLKQLQTAAVWPCKHRSANCPFGAVGCRYKVRADSNDVEAHMQSAFDEHCALLQNEVSVMRTDHSTNVHSVVRAQHREQQALRQQLRGQLSSLRAQVCTHVMLVNHLLPTR